MQPDALDFMEVVAVCDIIGTRAEELAEEFDIASWFDDYDELLANCDAEAILILVPGRLHFEQALRAVLSNRHVYVQKPLTNSVAEAATITINLSGGWGAGYANITYGP